MNGFPRPTRHPGQQLLTAEKWRPGERSPTSGVRASRPWTVGAVLWCALAALLAQARADDPPYTKSAHMLPMRDNVRLATDVFVPAGRRGPFPAILVRTPYNKDNVGPKLAAVVCRRGYAVVAQDLRGRFASEGDDALVFRNDNWRGRTDGHDTLRWIDENSLFLDRVGTWGGSALGIVQNMQAPRAPSALRAQFVVVAFSNMYEQAAYQGGAFRKSLVEGWLSQHDFDPKNLETVLAHPTYDELWEELNPENEAFSVNAPGVFKGGWYDVFLQGTINAFNAIQRRGGPRAQGRCRLIIGPWAHGKFEALQYPPNSRQPPPAEDAFRWFDYWLKGVDTGVAQDKSVYYYVMGDPTDPEAPGNYWREAERWPPPVRLTKAYLHDDGTLRLSPPTPADASLAYRYDPQHPVPTLGGQNLNLPQGPMDQREVERRDDVLVFTTPVLEEPVEVTGRLRARLFVESDCPDTDFTVKLTDVYPDGRSMLVTDGILRTRYRHSFKIEKMMQPGQIYEITVDLWSTSLVFNRGHRIRVAVSSSNYPRFQANLNTGGPVHEEGDGRIATNTVHLSREHPSHIELPVYGGPEQRWRPR
jgi:hypothetical protein